MASSNYYLKLFEEVKLAGGKKNISDIKNQNYGSSHLNEFFFPKSLKRGYSPNVLELKIIDDEKYLIVSENQPITQEMPWNAKYFCDYCDKKLTEDNILNDNIFFEIENLEKSYGDDIYETFKMMEAYEKKYENGDYKLYCIDCDYVTSHLTKPKKVKYPQPKDYDLTVIEIQRLEKEKIEITNKIDDPMKDKSFLEVLILNRNEIKNEYQKQLIEWKKKNKNYYSYLSHLNNWKRYNDELEEYEDEKNDIKTSLRLEKEKNQRTKSIKYWSSLNGVDFEKGIGKLFENLGHKVELTSATGDKGVDLFVDKDKVVQCKAHEAQISPSVIREMYGTMIHFKKKKAIVISTGGFTKGCYDFAKGKPIELWDLEKIIEKVKSTGI